MIPRLLRSRGEYRALAAYISGTVIGTRIDGLLREPWRLLGIDGHPPSLDRLRYTLENLCAVVGELANDDADPHKIRRSALSVLTPRSNSTSCPLQLAADSCRATNRRRQQRRRAEIRSVCRSTGLMSRVFDTAHGPYDGVEYRVSVVLESLFGWADEVERLESALRATKQPGETYLFVPLRNGRPVPRHAVRLIESLWLAPNPDGLDKLRTAHTGRLAEIFDHARLALQTLSGICDLPEEQRAHSSVQAVAETLNSELETALRALHDLPDDTVTARLLAVVIQLAARVQAEVAGTSTEPSFAAELNKAVVTRERTDDSTVVAFWGLLASEWDIDPRGAVGQFLDASD